MKQLLNRRQLLRGAGGAALAIPFLPSILPRRAWASDLVAANEHARFVFVGSRFGRDINRGRFVVDGQRMCPWYPNREPEHFQNGVGETSLADCQDYEGSVSKVFSGTWDELRDRYTLIRGLDGMQIKGDAHGTAMAMTGSGSLGGGTVGFGYSIDCIFEESPKIYPYPPQVSAIRTSVGQDGNQSFSYTSRGGSLRNISSEMHPGALYNKYFRPDVLQSRQTYESRQRPVLNLVMDDYRSLSRNSRLSAVDRQRLEAHLDMISRIEQQLGVSVDGCTVSEPGEFSGAEELQEITMDLEVAALACGMTNIVSHVIMQHNSEIRIIHHEAHGAAHGGMSSKAETGRTPLAQYKVDHWVMQRVARFIKKLDEVPSENGSLLDSTLVMYGNWEARGYHSFYDMPVLVAGRPDRLRLGLFLDYRPRPLLEYDKGRKVYPGRPYNQLLISVLQAMGFSPDEYERFGQKGFGVYDGYAPQLADHYRPFLQDKNAVLPGLLRA